MPKKNKVAKNYKLEKFFKKNLFKIILLITFIGLVMANVMKNNNPNPNDGFLRITKSPWSGWSKQQPDDSVMEILPKKGEKIELIGLYNKDLYELEIINVDDNSIHLQIDGLSLKQGEGLKAKGINLRGCGLQKFVMTKGETVELNTCSMDMGVSWTLQY